MRCAEIKNLLSHYLEEDLKTKTKKMLDEHLTGCSVCREELAQLKEIISGLKKMPGVEPPPYFLEAVHARLLEERPTLLERFLKRLFVPFYIKVPLEAITVTATVIIISVLVQKSEIARLTPTSEMLEASRQNTERIIPSKEEPKQFIQIHPLEIGNQMPQQPSMVPALRSWNEFNKTREDLLRGMQEGKAISYKNYKNALTNALPLNAFRLEGIRFRQDIKEGVDFGEDAKIKKEPFLKEDLREGFLSKVMMKEEIILKTQDLTQDKPKLESILQDLGITHIKIETYPEKVSFSFSILTPQREILLSKLKDWQVLSAPTKEITAKEELLLGPISVKITLTTQETP